MEETMRPTTASDNVFDINAGTVFDHPKDVVAHPHLSIAETSHPRLLGFLAMIRIMLKRLTRSAHCF
jgi:hypothetical protein